MIKDESSPETRRENLFGSEENMGKTKKLKF